MKLIGLAILLLASLCFAQDDAGFKPATTNVSGAEYPRVDSNSRVQIRVKAPDATKVKLNFWSGPKVDMEKQPDGFWLVTTPPMAPGLHYYTVIIDGAEVSDPNSYSFYGGSKDASAVEVPEAGRNLLFSSGCSSRTGARGLVSFRRHRNVQTCAGVHASRL